MNVDAALSRLAREEGGRVIALLARRLGDLHLADDAVADAYLEAARTWPDRGVPDNPGGWLMVTARRRALDRLRRAEVERRRRLAAGREVGAPGNDHGDGAARRLVDDGDADGPEIADAQLRVILLCCHPALDRDAQVVLTLRLGAGLRTPEIAAALMVPEPTVAQRIVRAKRKIRDAGIPLRLPADPVERLEAVRFVLYLLFNEGYLATSRSDLQRVDLAEEAIRLTRLMVALRPGDAETLGLLALQLFHRARADARTDPDGDLVLLADQDRTHWDRWLIAEANTVLASAMARRVPGRYQLQAVIAGVHANAADAATTNWRTIVTAYEQLRLLDRSPVIALNHAVAVAMHDGPAAGLAMLRTVDGLDHYHLFHAARADLLRRTGEVVDARQAYELAITLAANDVEVRYLRRRLAELT